MGYWRKTKLATTSCLAKNFFFCLVSNIENKRLVLIKKKSGSKKTPYNRKILKSSKHGHFAKAIVKQNGHIYREVERKGLLILQYVFLFSNILRKTEKGRF